MEEITRRAVEIVVNNVSNVSPVAALVAALVVLLLPLSHYLAFSLSGLSGHPVIPGVEPKSIWVVMQAYTPPLLLAFIFAALSALLLQYSSLSSFGFVRNLFYLLLFLCYLFVSKIFLDLINVSLITFPGFIKNVIFAIFFLLPFLIIFILYRANSIPYVIGVFLIGIISFGNFDPSFLGVIFINWGILIIFLLLILLALDYFLAFNPRAREEMWKWKFSGSLRNQMVLLSVLLSGGNLMFPLESCVFLNRRSLDSGLALESVPECLRNEIVIFFSLAFILEHVLLYIYFNAYLPEPLRQTKVFLKNNSELASDWHFVATTQEGFLLSKVDNVDNNDVPSRNKLTIVPFSEVVRLEIEVIERRQNETSFRQRMQDLPRRLHQARERFAGRRSQGSQGSASPEGRL